MDHFRTLVLNDSYKAISIVPWHRAIALLYAKNAETLMFWDKIQNKFIYCEYDKTVSNYDRRFVYRIPSVIRMLKPNTATPLFFKKYRPKFSKINVFYRDNFQCQYCGFQLSKDQPQRRKDGNYIMTIDHILPVSKGGKTTFENCVCACTDCNAKKADMTPEEANLKLKKKPVPPNYEILIKRKMSKKQLPDIWKNYIKL